MKNHEFFDLFDLLISITSETLILSYCGIFMTYTNIHLKNFVDNTCCILEKQIYQLLLNYEASIVYLKANYHLNQT